MKVIQLFNSINRDCLWNYIFQHQIKNELAGSEIELTPEGVKNIRKNIFDRFFSELAKLNDTKTSDQILVVYKEPNDLLSNEFRVYAVDSKLEEVGIELMAWGKIINTPILDILLNELSTIELAAAIFWEMTRLGFTEEEIATTSDRIKNELEKCEDVITNSKSYTLDEVETYFESKGLLPKLTPDEKDKRKEQLHQYVIESKRRYDKYTALAKEQIASCCF